VGALRAALGDEGMLRIPAGAVSLTLIPPPGRIPGIMTQREGIRAARELLL
jgi:hypothetical protein